MSVIEEKCKHFPPVKMKFCRKYNFHSKTGLLSGHKNDKNLYTSCLSWRMVKTRKIFYMFHNFPTSWMQIHSSGQ